MRNNVEVDLADLKPKPDALRERIRKYLSKKSHSNERVSMVQLCDAADCSPKRASAEIEALHAAGYNVEVDASHNIELSPTLPKQANIKLSTSDYFGDNWVRFGVIGDTHLVSHYSRLDVLNALYDVYEREGIKVVYHCGNWIDGEARFNKYDICCVGFENQVAYFLKHYPKRKGITTHIISGDDHEGWYVQREQINVGKVLQDRAQEVGREDIVDLGYMERDIEFKRGKGSSVVRVMHAGGGSTYAISYTSQKLAECVPMDSEILTKRGWKKHYEISVGEHVLGYNEMSGICEWTAVTAINHGTGHVSRHYNDQFDVRCTDNHRWVQEVEQRAGPNKRSRVPTPYSRKYRETSPLHHTKRRARLIQSAPAVDGPGFRNMQFHDWLNRKDAVGRVLEMTSGERRAFIEGMLVGEGHWATSNSGARHLGFSQNAGPVLDAFRLACFLEGIATTERPTSGGSFKPEVEHARRVTLLKKPYRFVNKLNVEPLGEQNVWCPTTELGTWVMRQGRNITITGNSLQGGEKPAVMLVGHFHKFDWAYPREITVLQPGCTQDQTPFMRKKRIQSMVGGCILEAKQDRLGVFNRVRVEWMPFFDKKFYTYHWNNNNTVKSQ